MTLESRYQFTMETRWYLSSYRAASDVRFAISQYPSEEMSFSRWQVNWAGICALLKTSIVLLRVDSKRCYPGPLKDSLAEAWHRLGRHKDEFPLYWDFVNHERNNILKEYEFSAYAQYLKEDGTIQDVPTLLGMIGAKQILKIAKGPFAGRDALELASDAAAWTISYIDEAIREAGLDPDERVTASNFLRRQQGLPAVEQEATGGGLLAYLEPAMTKGEDSATAVEHVSDEKEKGQ